MKKEKRSIENKQYIIFNVGQEEYGVEISLAKEITKKLYITSLPQTDKTVLGLVDLRGEVFPVLDFHEILNIKKNKEEINEDEQRIITARIEEKTVGFLVDKIAGLKTISIDNIKEPPNMVNKHNLIKGVYTDSENGMFIILDLMLVFDSKKEKLSEINKTKK